MTKENLWKNYTDEQKRVIFDFAEDYKKYLDSAKTEREFVDLTEKELEKNIPNQPPSFLIKLIFQFT